MILDAVLYLVSAEDKNYFVFCDDRMLVKNDWYFWRNDVFEFEKCEKTQFYELARVRFMLTITKKNGKRRGYQSAISRMQIDTLKSTLEGYGMQVEDTRMK